jgi:hypothetical protein
MVDKGGQVQFQIWFQPDAVKSYPDSIVFISDAGYNIDPVCLIEGEGIEPQLEATGDDWGKRRAHLTKYDTYQYYKFTPYPSPSGAIVLKNDGSKEVSINKINILEDVRGEAFEININGKLEPLKNYINSLGQIKDASGNSITVIPAGEQRYIPVFFHPRAEGDYKLKIEYESDAPVRPFSQLTGIGIYPKLTTADVDYGTRVMGEPASKKITRITNNTWAYQDAVTIQSLTIAPNGGISVNLGTPGTEGFSYDQNAIRLGMAGIVKFPQVLQPGDYMEIDGEFVAVKTGNHASSLTTVSDADVDVTSNWTGFGIAESLVLNGGAEPFLCYNTNDEITCTLVNNGSSAITIPANGVTLINQAPSAGTFIIDRMTRTDLSLIDGTKDWTIGISEQVKIVCKFLPLVKQQNNVEEIHTATVQVKSLAVTQALQTLTTGVKARAIHYTRTSESSISGKKIDNGVTIVEPGMKDPVTYLVNINPGQELVLANPTEYIVTVSYEKNFLGILQKNGKHEIFPGRDLPTGWTVSSYKMSFDEAKEIETITVTLKGNTPVKSKDKIELLRIEFFAFLPWYKDAQGNMTVKAKQVKLEHKIATNEQCVDYVTPLPCEAKLTETCVDNLRPIMVSLTDYNLGMINPNPVGANGTEISFSIAFTDFVEIRIIGTNGEIIDTPISKEMKAGNYTLRLPIEKLTNGSYILEMKSGEFNENRKFNVVK